MLELDVVVNHDGWIHAVILEDIINRVIPIWLVVPFLLLPIPP
jgi:hypothetical protein